MRILIIDFAYQNNNRTVMLWQSAWKLIGDIIFFGPGYVSDDEWQAGVKKFEKKNGPFDVIVSNELLLSSLNDEGKHSLLTAIKNTYYCPFPIKSSILACEKNYFEFLEMSGIKIIFCNFDAYNMVASHKKRLEESNLYVVGWGEQFVRPIEQLKDLKKESFYDLANDRWYDFVTKYKNRIISSPPAMVSENEFCWSYINKRPNDWVIQGARYYAREGARSVLKKNKIKNIGKSSSYIISFLGLLDRKILTNRFVMNTLNYLWDSNFRNSKYAYTCGSALNVPVRKYFEIPASGSILITNKLNGFLDLGFKNFENAILANPDDLPKINNWLNSNSDEVYKIAKNGQNLVWERHTVFARSKQYKAALESIYSKKFKGSKWSAGDFQILVK